MSKIQDKARYIAKSYLDSGNLRLLLEEVSYYSIWFGRFGSANRVKFLKSLFSELNLQTDKEG